MHRAILWIASLVLVASCAAPDACSDCAISAERIATFGESDGDGALESRPLVSREFNGLRIVWQPEGSGQLPRLFTATGRFRSTLGTLGDGPSEFRSPLNVLVAGDTAWILDGNLRRATVVNRSGSLASSFSWQRVPGSAFRRGDGSWIVAGGTSTTRSMAVISDSGIVLQEFGDSTGPFGTRRFLAQDGRRFWSAPSLNRLRFEEWSGPDSLLRVVEPVTPHFPPYERLLPPAEERPPIRALRGFWLDSLAHIWAVIEVPASDWRSGYGPARVGEGGQSFLPMQDPNRAYSSVILVIEPSTGRIVAERTLDGWFFAVVEPWVLLRAVQDADGWYQAELWRVGSRTQ